MDLAIIVDSTCCLAALAIPMWIVCRLPRYYLSVPIGALTFWGWLTVDGYLLLGLDSEYDSIGPGMFLLTGWAIGGIYCVGLMIIHKIISSHRKSRSTVKAGKSFSPPGYFWAHYIFGLCLWGCLSVLCVFYPFMDSAKYGNKYWKFHLFAFGPTLLLSITMSLIYLRYIIIQTCAYELGQVDFRGKKTEV